MSSIPSIKSTALSSTITIYQAPWVVPICYPVIKDGAVAVSNGRILAVGSAYLLEAQFVDAEIRNYQGVLLPGLVNAHIHLELSAYTDIAQPTSGQSFCDWIRSLLQARQQSHIDPAELARVASETLQQQHATGVGLLLDIGNVLPSTSTSLVTFLLELLGPTGKAEEQVLARLAGLPDAVAATAHAPYSTTAGIMTALKHRADRLGHVFSLHVAESADEIELLGSGHGCFRGFLEERDAWDDRFPVMTLQSPGTVEYLDHLGLLAANLLCVHCVHVSEKEVQLLAAHGCKVCLCPGSNRFLGSGIAPVELMLRHGLLPAIGTDSAASNVELDLWREMQILHEDHSQVSAAQILSMATLGGAQAIGRDHDCGTLAPGRKAMLLNVDSLALQSVQDERQLLDILTGSGRPESIGWLGETEEVGP